MTLNGFVNDRLESVLPLKLRGPAGREVAVTAVIDTGFSESLTLPKTVISNLGLVRQSGGRAILADGSSCRYHTYAAQLDWGGTWRPVTASAIGDEVLVGVRLLEGHELRIRLTDGGAVSIDPLSDGETE